MHPHPIAAELAAAFSRDLRVSTEVATRHQRGIDALAAHLERAGAPGAWHRLEPGAFFAEHASQRPGERALLAHSLIGFYTWLALSGLVTVDEACRVVVDVAVAQPDPLIVDYAERTRQMLCC